MDIESLFSLDDEYSPQALVVVAYSTSEEVSEPDSEYDSDPEIQTIYTSQPIIAPLTNPTPIAQVHLLLDTYSRPIPVIALFDTGAAATILHPRNNAFRKENGHRIVFYRLFGSKYFRWKVYPAASHSILFG